MVYQYNPTIQYDEEEEQRKREAADTSGWSHLKDLVREWGDWLGERGWGGTAGVPPEQRTAPFPGTTQPPGAFVFPDPRTTRTPLERPVNPNEYKQRAAAGGWGEIANLTPGKSVTVKEEDKTTGIKTTTKTENRGPQAPKGQAGPQQQVIQGSQYGQFPSGPMEAPLQPGGIQTPPNLPPGMTPGGGYISPEQQMALKGQQAQYQAPFKAGVPEETIAPLDWAKKREELLKDRTQKINRLIREAYPERGQLLNDAYEKIGKISKPTRILMAILRGNPFWTDEQAGLEADVLAHRAEGIANKKIGVTETEYTEMKGIVDGLETRQKEKMKIAMADLAARLETEPELVYNREAARLAALNMGIAPRDVDQYLDDHKDPKTGKYNLLKDPNEERLIMVKNGANSLKQLFPFLTDQMAILAFKSPATLVELATDEAKYYHTKALHETDQELKAKWQAMGDAALAVQVQIANNPSYRKYVMLISTRQNKEAWDKMTPDEKKTWGVDFLGARREAFGPDPEKDPERLAMKDIEQAARIRGILLENSYRQLMVAKGGKELQESGADNILLAGAKKLDPRMTHKNTTETTRTEVYNRQSMVLEAMSKGQVPPAPKDLTKEEPASRQLRSDADAQVQAVWERIPKAQQEQLGGSISYKEASTLMRWLYNIETAYPPQYPSYPYLISELLKDREETEKKSKKKK